MKDYAAEYVNKKLEILGQFDYDKKVVDGMDYEEEYVEINGMKQYFLHYPGNSDTVVLFIHGGPGYAIGYYAYKFKPEGKEFTSVFYDQRGAGKTQLKNPSKAEDVTFERLLQDLHESVTYIHSKYPDKKLILLGHSWGSVLGMEYVKHHQDTISAYVGCGQVIDFKKGEKRAYEHLLKAIMEQEDVEGMAELKKCEGYPDNLIPETAMEQIQEFRSLQVKYKDAGFRDGDEATEKMLLESPTFGKEDMEILKNYLYVNSHLIGNTLAVWSTEADTEFDIPIYFIQGRDDWQTPSVCVEEYCEIIEAPDKKYYEVENTGHLLYLEEPGIYNQILCEICERVKNCMEK